MKRILAPCVLLVLALSGCSAERPADTDAATSAAAESATITITDHTGNEVEIPAQIDRVAVDEIPIASTYLAYHEGNAPYLVGMSAAVVNALEDTVVAEMAPELLDVETGYYSDGELNVEELLTLDPDVVFYNANNTEHAAAFEAAGIPAVGFATSGDPTTVYADWLNLLEDVFQEPGKMDSVIDYGQDLIVQAQDRTASVEEEDQKNALIIFNYAQGTLRVAGTTPFFGSYWLQTANAANAADAEGGLAPVTAEQVLAWDPDVILIGGSGQAGITPAELLNGEVDGLDLKALAAVTDGEVYSNDLGMWSWFTPNPDAPVVANWIGAVIYPEAFDDVDLPQVLKDYYQKVYNYELTDAQASEILAGTAS